MEFGNVYEVFQIGDRVRVKDISTFYYNETGTIIGIEETGRYTVPIYTVELEKYPLSFDDNKAPREIQVNATSLEKIPRKHREETVITSGKRNGKAMRTLLEKMVDESSQFDAALYSFDFLNKLTGGTDEMKKLDVKKIIFSGPKTIVLWTDGTKTIVSMSKDELRFDPEAAFCAAYTKKMFGSNSKIKRIIEQKSNFEEYTKAAIENAETEFDKFMKCTCPWLYTEEKPTEVEEAIAKATSEFYKEELAPKENKDDEN